jgi:hypothetical protein
VFAQQVAGQRHVLYNVVDLLTACVRKHGMRARGRVIKDGLVGKVARLVAAPYPHVALAATRFLKAIVQLHDAFYYRHVAAEHALAHALAALETHRTRENMLNSALIDLFNVIANVRPYALHVSVRAAC